MPPPESNPDDLIRHLRDMEENGWVTSEWHTEEAGPAKRIYQLTDEGREILSFWIGCMDQQAQKLNRFIDIYEASQCET